MLMCLLRHILVPTAAVILLIVDTASSQDTAPHHQTGLAELAAQIRPDFLIGAHLSASHMPDVPENAKPQSIIASEYNLVSVGFYQRSTQRKSRTDWNFSAIDPIVDFAEENGLKVYAHPMFGSNGYLPDWLMEGDFSDEELLEIIEERIKTLLTRYRGRIHYLDVYNEGLGRTERGWRENDNLLLRLGWNENDIGRWPIALEKILVWCRKYGGEDLKLIYNENNNTLADMPQSLDCIQLHTALKKAGIPIDGIGIQCHTKITAEGDHQLSASSRSRGPTFDAASFGENMRRMGAAGIDVHVTECDVHLYGQIDDQKLALQADAYRAILGACIGQPACKSFKTWGFTDASCWKAMLKQGAPQDYEPYPLVFDHEYQPKRAYWAMRDLLLTLATSGDNR